MGRKIRSLKIKFRKITILPLIIFGVLSLLATSFLIYTSMREETEDGLQNLAHAMYKICDLSGEGDYSLVNHTLYRGNQPFDNDFKIVDDIKKTSGVDATIFWDNQRVSTTIRDNKGNRTIGTSSVTEVKETVLKHGQEYFSDNVFVNDVPYFGFYTPLKNSDDTIVGMLFVGKPRTTILQTIYQIIGIITLILLLMICFVSSISLHFSRNIIQSLNAMMKFLGKITKGDVKAPLDESVLRRDDEIGEMGRFSIMLQKSVTELINTDTLTGLYNRRCSTLFLEDAVKDFYDNDIPFTIVIGDIDDFKKINDTYGHAAGDEVLKLLSQVFKQHMGRGSTVARWGGEEFLFIFKHKNKEETCNVLQEIQETIHQMQCPFTPDKKCKFTMTFGVSEYHDGMDIEMTLKRADDKLYHGKETGKDCVIIN